MVIHDGKDSSRYFAIGLQHVTSVSSAKMWFKSKKVKIEQIADKTSTLVIVGTTHKTSLEFIKNQLNFYVLKGYDISCMMIVIVDYFKDSMIRDKYIRHNLLRGSKSQNMPQFVFVEFNELDYVVQVEDGYNDCFSLKSLSKNYKKQLQKVKLFLNEVDKQEIDKQEDNTWDDPHKKGGGKYANSSLV